MGVGGDKFRGVPDNKSIVYENLSKIKADFLTDHG